VVDRHLALVLLNGLAALPAVRGPLINAGLDKVTARPRPVIGVARHLRAG